jgi:hypothetical protein
MVVVDPDPANEPKLDNSDLLFVQGDIMDAAVRAKCVLSRAKGVAMLTDEDLLNLEAATVVIDQHPSLGEHVVVHLADISMKRILNQRLAGPDTAMFSLAAMKQRAGMKSLDDSDAIGHEHAGIIPVAKNHVFNGHRIAARQLVISHLVPYFKSTPSKDVVVIAGFGRFGQTLLEIMQREAKGEFDTVVIVDPEADLKARVYQDQVGYDRSYGVHLVNGTMDDPQTWDEVESVVSGAESKMPVYLLASGEDADNLRRAMGLRERHPNGHIIVRCFQETAFTRRTSEKVGFSVFGMSALLEESLVERHKLWFMSRKKK